MSDILKGHKNILSVKSI